MHSPETICSIKKSVKTPVKKESIGRFNEKLLENM